jgi:2-iminoacetate synthase ThiH
MPVSNPELAGAVENAQAGKRINPAQALALLTDCDLLKLGNLAHKARLQKSLPGPGHLCGGPQY